MGSGKNWLQRGVCYAGALVLGAFLVGTEARCKDSVAAFFTLRDSTLSLHEPLYVHFFVRNELAQAISFDLGFDRKQGFEFSITQPDGTTVRLPRYERGGIGAGGVVTVEPAQTYNQSILLNELHQITKPGDYQIAVRLTVPIQTLSGRKIEPTASENMRLHVTDLDPKHLSDVCERLAKAATKGPGYQSSQEAAFGLSYVQDPIAVPHLARVLTEGDAGLKALAIRGLARIRTPEAAQVLTSNLNSIEPWLKPEIEAALWEIKTGRKLEILD